MKILLLILLLLVLAVVVILLLALRQPKFSRFLRQTLIKAPMARVYEQINSLRKYNEWDPWSQDDPEQKITYEGEEGAVGSTLTWEGKKTGTGHMTLSEANGTDAVAYQLTFIKPFQGEALARLTLAEVEGGTEVTWEYSAENAFIARIVGVFMNFEKMIGSQYDRGLATLKDMCEAKT